MAQSDLQGKPEDPTRAQLYRMYERLSFLGLIKEIRHHVAQLLQKEVSLVKTELKADIQTEVKSASWLGVAALFGLLSTVMLLVSGVLALALLMPAWAAGLVVSGILIIITLICVKVGWSRRLRSPLVRTREVLRSEVTFSKEGFA